MKRPKRGYIPQGGADSRIYWQDNHDTAPGDGWVCADGGWHSRPIVEPCSEYCHCSIEGRKMLEELNREVEENRNVQAR